MGALKGMLQGCSVVCPDQVQSTVTHAAFTLMGGNSWSREEFKCLSGQTFLFSVCIVGGVQPEGAHNLEWRLKSPTMRVGIIESKSSSRREPKQLGSSMSL